MPRKYLRSLIDFSDHLVSRFQKAFSLSLIRPYYSLVIINQNLFLVIKRAQILSPADIFKKKTLGAL